MKGLTKPWEKPSKGDYITDIRALNKIEAILPSLSHFAVIQSSVSPAREQTPGSAPNGILDCKRGSPIHQPLFISGSDEPSSGMRGVPLKVVIPLLKSIKPLLLPSTLRSGN